MNIPTKQYIVRPQVSNPITAAYWNGLHIPASIFKFRKYNYCKVIDGTLILVDGTLKEYKYKEGHYLILSYNKEPTAVEREVFNATYLPYS